MMATTVRCEVFSPGEAAVEIQKGSDITVTLRVEILAALSFQHALAMRLPFTHTVVATRIIKCRQIRVLC